MAFQKDAILQKQYHIFTTKLRQDILPNYLAELCSRNTLTISPQVVCLYNVVSSSGSEIFSTTLQPFYNTIRYNTVIDITRFKDGSQKCIDYTEKMKWSFFNIIYTFLFGYNTVV